MDITSSEKIRLLSKRMDITLSEIAEKTGQTRQNLSNKMRRGNFNEVELTAIAKVLGCELEINFILPDGSKL